MNLPTRFTEALDGVVIDHLVIHDADVAREARRWALGARGPVIDDPEVLVEADLSAYVAEAVKIGAVDANRDLRGFTRQRLADPVAEEGQRLALHAGVARENFANVIQYLILGRAADAPEFDVKFAAVRREGVLAGLGPANLLLYGGDARYRQQVIRDAPPQILHPGDRCADRAIDLKDIVALAERG